MAKAKLPRAGSSNKSDAREVELFRRTLKRNAQVVPEDQPLTPGATHVEAKDPEGKTILIRKRFSAV